VHYNADFRVGFMLPLKYLGLEICGDWKIASTSRANVPMLVCLFTRFQIAIHCMHSSFSSTRAHV
jgi:hypothetical protein